MGLTEPQRMLFGPGSIIRPVGEIFCGHRCTQLSALRVCDLVCGNAVHKGHKRPSHVPVSRQSIKHGDANLLSHIVGEMVTTRQPAQSPSAVAQDHRAHFGYERFLG